MSIRPPISQSAHPAPSTIQNRLNSQDSPAVWALPNGIVDDAAVCRCRVLLRVVDEPVGLGGEDQEGIIKVVRRCVCALHVEEGGRAVEYRLQQVGDVNVVRELACLRS